MIDWLMILIIGAATVFGVVLLYLGWSTRREAEASRQWPAAEGRVTATGVAEVTETRRRISFKMHEAQVAYQYTVAGQAYSSDRIGWTRYRFADPALAQQFIAAYPAGGQVTVYYDPKRPASAVLRPDTEPRMSDVNSTGWGCLLGAVLLAGVLYVWPWLTHRAMVANATPPGETLADRPAQDLLLTTTPFPPDWVVNDPCEVCDLFNRKPDNAMRQFRITDMNTGVTQSVYRYASPAEARDKFQNARQNMAKTMSLSSDVRYQSPVAAEQLAGCGIDKGEYTCLTFSRFGQYLVALQYQPGGSSQPGLTAADVENLLRALDSLAMERLGAKGRMKDEG